jgi:hypothetical protein
MKVSPIADWFHCMLLHWRDSVSGTVYYDSVITIPLRARRGYQ